MKEVNEKMKGLGISIIDIAEKVQLQPEKIEEPKIDFPIDLLPEWLQETIKEHSESYGTPQELWAIAFLSGIATAAGKRIYLINNNYRNYPQLWIMVVGSSGTGKSEAFRVAFRRISEIDAEKFARYQEAYRDWEINEKAGAAPRWEQMIIGDTTPEAMFSVLAHSPNGLTLYRDELSGWFSDFGRYNKSGEVGHYISIFDNQALSINRKKEQPQLIIEPFLNIFGTIQPGILTELLNKKDFELSGFAQRFLFLYPEFPERKYKRTTTTPSTEFYDKVINAIVTDNGENEIFLSDEAEDRYEEFFNELEIIKSKSNDFWAAVYSKAQIQTLRLALTVKISRLVYEPDNQISETDMNAAIGMMRCFIASLEKFKIEQVESTGTKKEMITKIFSENPGANQTEVAKILGVSREYLNRVVRSQVTGHNDTKPFTVNDYRENEV